MDIRFLTNIFIYRTISDKYSRQNILVSSPIFSFYLTIPCQCGSKFWKYIIRSRKLLSNPYQRILFIKSLTKLKAYQHLQIKSSVLKKTPIKIQTPKNFKCFLLWSKFYSKLKQTDTFLIHIFSCNYGAIGQFHPIRILINWTTHELLNHLLKMSSNLFKMKFRVFCKTMFRK